MNLPYKHSLLGIILTLFTVLSSRAQSPISATVSATSSCQNDGTITVVVSGGDGSDTYTYGIGRAGFIYNQDGGPLVNNVGTNTSFSYAVDQAQVGPTSASTYTFTNLQDGAYRIFVYSQENSYDNYYDVTVPATFNTTLTFTSADCNGLNGSITAAPSGGTAPYTYQWLSGSTAATAILNSTTEGKVVVTDASGCQFHSIDSLYTKQTYAYDINIATTDANCNTKGTATVSILNGDPNRTYTYYWNSTPIQSTATATNLEADVSYTVLVTDDNGCKMQGYAYTYQSQTEFDLTIGVTNVDCQQANGTVTATPLNGTAPFTYTWNTGATTQSVANLTGNAYYTVTAKDANGCQSIKTVYLNTLTPILLNFSVDAGTCNNSDGSATVTATGGVEPYTYAWVGNSSTTNTISNVTGGGYNVQVTDINGCVASGTVVINKDSVCYARILGAVYHDINQNGIQDSGEPYINAAIGLANNYYTYGMSTDIGYGANYEFLVSPGTTYNVSVTVPNHWKIANGSSAQLTVNALIDGHLYTGTNFGLVPDEDASDVSVQLFANSQRPGYSHDVSITYTNTGTEQETGTITYTFSEGWNIYVAYPTPDSYDPSSRKATWSYANLGVLETRWIDVYMYVPLNVSLGTVVTADAVITNSNTDVDLSNNESSCQAIIQNSYDPNELQVSPQGTGTEGYITDAQDELTYKIDFQNTGTAVAYDVTVKNDMDSNLDPSTFTVVSSSHPCKATLTDGKFNFDFPSINLVDSNHNEPASHGFVIYKIKRIAGLAPDTKILNQASIYFDYNVPVATNQVKNTIARTTASLSAEQTNQDVVLYPNPSNNQFSIRFNAQEDGKASVQLYSASGQEIPLAEDVEAIAGNNTINLNLAPYNLNNGLYIVKLLVGAKSYTKNLVVSR